MPDAPLSRRARRTFEEEAADRAAAQEPTSALPQAPTSGEVRAAENERVAAMSRRDRRRLERLNHPLEAWTAEEEMIATGQIPVMTPERIAEQERISREKAEKAAQEAIAASQELRRLQASDVRPAPPVAPEAPTPPALSVPQAPHAPQTPHAPWSPQAPPTAEGIEFPTPPTAAPFPGGAAATGETGSHEASVPGADSHEVTALQPDDHVGRPVLKPYQPVMALDDAPLAPVAPSAHHEAEPQEVAPVHDAAPTQDTAPLRRDDAHDLNQGGSVESSPAPSGAVEPVFPTGASQTAMRHSDPFAENIPQGNASADSGHVPTLLPPQEVPERASNPVDEIRRLAAEAMSGIERASKSDEEAATAAAGRRIDPAVSGEFDSLPSAAASVPQPSTPPARPSTPPVQQAPPVAGPLANFSWEQEVAGASSANSADTKAPVDSLGDWTQSREPMPTTPSGGMTAHRTGFDQLPFPASGSEHGAAPASGQFAMPVQQGQPASGQFAMPVQQGQPAPQGLAGPQGPAWNTQPLSTEPGRAAEAEAFTPVTDVPKPDFSGLYKQQQSPAAFPPVSGAINTAALNSAEFRSADPTASGQIPAIRRPDLPEVGGVKHFKWVHLSVIGALMFVLGVVIYNVAFHR